MLILCGGHAAHARNSAAQAGDELTADKQATRETVALLRNLRRLSATGFLFGHQDDLAYGVNWKYQAGRSDVREVCGDYPALYGWDLSGMESGSANDIDGVPFSFIRHAVQAGYARGGVITFSWHAPCPMGSGRTAWDTVAGTVASILPSGENHDLYLSWLDKLASFLGGLRGTRGESIPVLLRPFHELTGSWFWWGRSECSPTEFATLWRFTKYYLNQVKGLHNILWVYNTSGDFTSSTDFLARYPGDDAVDVVSFDSYQYGSAASFVTGLADCLKVLDDVAAVHGKVPAIAETGYEQIPDSTWWTGTLLRGIGTARVAYILVWRNQGYNPWAKPPHNEYYAPYAGQASAADFVRFYSLENTMFERDIAKEKMYE